MESNSSITNLPTYPTYFNVTNISCIKPGYPLILSQNPPSTPWYIQYLPELILIAGIASTVLTFYFSPGLRGAVKRLFLRK
ncbi:hypothetical protein D1867_00085 [Acidianus infernus]|uniref:Uncharacterized protein n=1 Tax=Acidianus infernus TaxID=12915 RepID=A0A6A9QK29_ACIIN|nr:hypothetical protein [Acidianus infernus]MUM63687.1 hypothetical protein [Acidianus infernus]